MDRSVERPETRYATSGDVHVAYQVSGSGPIDMVLATGSASHLDLEWTWPPRARFLDRLSATYRVIRFDKRGTGLSDRPTEAATIEERTDDIRAVMEAVGSERAVIFGSSEGGNMACVFAATYPERTRTLLLWGAQARWLKAEDYPWGASVEEAEADIARLAEHGVDREYLVGPGAGMGETEEDRAFVDWWIRYARAGASPSALVALEQMTFDIDVRGVLPAISTPTLVMVRSHDPIAHVDAARQMAELIPGAAFVEYPGRSHMIMGDDMERILGDIEEFVTGVRPAPASDRVFATVVFTDIVGSTERAAQVGDAAWRDLLAEHHAIVRAQIERFRGVEVDTAGDGFFVVFDGPARAVRFARAASDTVAALGIEIRSGVHAGEVERDPEGVRGVAVHTGARIAALAAPDETLVSRTVKDLTAGSGLVFADRGTHTLKGISEPWALYAAVGDELPA